MDKLSRVIESIFKDQKPLFSTDDCKLYNLLVGAKSMRELMGINRQDAAGFSTRLGEAAKSDSYSHLVKGMSSADLASYNSATMRMVNIPATASEAKDTFI